MDDVRHIVFDIGPRLNALLTVLFFGKKQLPSNPTTDTQDYSTGDYDDEAAVNAIDWPSNIGTLDEAGAVYLTLQETVGYGYVYIPTLGLTYSTPWLGFRIRHGKIPGEKKGNRWYITVADAAVISENLHILGKNNPQDGSSNASSLAIYNKKARRREVRESSLRGLGKVSLLPMHRRDL